MLPGFRQSDLNTDFLSQPIPQPMTKDDSLVALDLWSVLVALQAGSGSVNPNHSRGASENILDPLSPILVAAGSQPQ